MAACNTPKSQVFLKATPILYLSRPYPTSASWPRVWGEDYPLHKVCGILKASSIIKTVVKGAQKGAGAQKTERFSADAPFSTPWLVFLGLCIEAHGAEQSLTGEMWGVVVMDMQAKITTSAAAPHPDAAGAAGQACVDVVSMRAAVALARESLKNMGVAVPNQEKSTEQFAASAKFVQSLLVAGVDGADLDSLMQQGVQKPKRISKFLDRLERFFDRLSRELNPQRPRPPIQGPVTYSAVDPEVSIVPLPKNRSGSLIQAEPGDLCEIRAEYQGTQIASLQYNKFASGVRICGLAIEPDYRGRGVAQALLRNLEKVVRSDCLGAFGASVAIVTASVQLKAEAVPLLMTFKRAGFEVVKYSSTSDRIDLRWELRDAQLERDIDIHHDRRVSTPTVCKNMSDILEALEEGEQLGFFTPVKTEVAGSRALASRFASVIQVSSAVGTETEGYLIVWKDTSESTDTGETLRILQMGFHPMLKPSEAQKVAKEMVQEVRRSTDAKSIIIPKSSIIERSFFEALAQCGFKSSAIGLGSAILISRCGLPRKPR